MIRLVSFLPTASVLLFCGLFGNACTPTSSPQSMASASSRPSANPNQLLYGGAPLKQRLQQALAAKGPTYKARTKHKDAKGQPLYTNRLILETSPYLGQHAHNPVNWFPWGEEAFEVAKKLGRPVFLSVGYSTCHWCHVMEEESFEDLEIARYLNENYVCIKLDREERPDVDAVYMRSVQLLTGRGGWPMSVWLTHEREPFFGGTYFPPRDGARGTRRGFLTLLREHKKSFSQDAAAVVERAKKMAYRIKMGMRPAAASGLPGATTVARAVSIAKRRYDPIFGGASGRPKFPSSFPTRLLLRDARRNNDKESKKMALHTLRMMSRGGMYDHVGGGFHRYSVDSRWLVPHFEKMLYDNALLSVAYLEGFLSSGDADMARVARETLDYVMREMQSPEGGYYSATDADSLNSAGHREEGYYFTWTPAELRGELGEAASKIVATYYDVSPSGNFEGRNILNTPRNRDEVAKELNIDRNKLDSTIEEARVKLRKARNLRPKPIRDDKVQVSWNGLMVTAMAYGGRILGDARYLRSAERAANFLLGKLVVAGRLHHSYKDGKTTTKAFAEDHAFLAAGLIGLFESTQNIKWLNEAIGLMNELEKHHAHHPSGGYFRSANDAEKLLAREMEKYDGAVPASSSIALMVQLRLSLLTTDDVWRQRSEATLRAFAQDLERRPFALDEMMLGLDFFSDTSKEIFIARPKEDEDKAHTASMLNVLRQNFIPNHVFAMATENATTSATAARVPWTKGKPARAGKATAYVCERGACDLPTTDPKKFAAQLKQSSPYPGPTKP
jgi:uncharacterized protein